MRSPEHQMARASSGPNHLGLCALQVIETLLDEKTARADKQWDKHRYLQVTSAAPASPAAPI